MKYLRLPLALLCLVTAGYSQLLPEQKLLDFQQLVALYAKQYAPYEWKRDALGIDLLQIGPWLTKVRDTKSDIEFYEVCAAYVASLNDAHSQFFLPTDFQADLLFEVDLYEGKALIDFIDPSIARGVTFQIGDELISVDGKSAADWIKELGKYNSFANRRSTDRNSASLITFRPQVIYPRAMEIGDTATVVVRRKTTGSLQTYTLPWDKSGLPITVIGPVPAPKLTTASARSDEGVGSKPVPTYMKPLMSLRNYRMPEQKNVRGYGEITPVFQPSFPSSFTRRLGRNTDFFYSGTFSAGGKRIGFIRIPDFLDSNSFDLEPFALQQFQTEMTFMQNNTDGMIVDIMRNPGGDGCYAESLLQRLIPYRFRGTGQEVRVTREWVLAFSEAIDQANFFGVDTVTLDQLQAILTQLQSAYKQNHVRTDAFPQCATYFERDPVTDRTGNVLAYSKPVMLLTDEFSVSAAEVFASVFQDSRRGPVFGWRTAGAGGSIPLNPASTGFYSEASAFATQALLVRTEQVYTSEFPTTSYIENVGVRPDIAVDYMTEDNLTNRGKAFVERFTASMLELIK